MESASKRDMPPLPRPPISPAPVPQAPIVRRLIASAGLAAAFVALLAFVPAAATQAATDAAAEGAPIVAVTPPTSLDPAAATGRSIFAAKCAQCHGAEAGGRYGLGPPLIHPFYRPGHHADAAFLLAVRNGVPAHHWRFGNMPPVPGLTEGDVKMIVAYVRAVQQANGIR